MLTLPDGCQVVVAGDGDVRVAAQEGDAGARVGAVADDIAGAPEAVERARLLSVLERRLEGREVGVDVGDDSDTHGPRPTTSEYGSSLLSILLYRLGTALVEGEGSLKV